MAHLSSHSVSARNFFLFNCAQRKYFSNTHQGKSSIFATNSTKFASLHSCKIPEQNVLTSVQKSSSSLLHSTNIDSRIQSISEFNDLLIDFVKQNKPENALKLYDDISVHGLAPNLWTFSIAIKCHCKTNDLDGAKRVLDNMLEMGICPNVATFTILIDSFSKRGRMRKAFEVFELMDRFGCSPTVLTYNCLMKGLCYVGRVDEAYDMLMDMKEGGSFRPDVYSYTSVMDGMCKAGRTDEGMELLDEALEMGLVPSAVTFNTLLDGYCREGRLAEGFGLMKVMKEKGFAPSCVNYRTLLNGLLQWGEFRPALRIYKEMQVEGFLADEKMTRSLLRGLCGVSCRTVDLLDEMFEVFEQFCRVYVLDSGTLNMVFGALCKRKKFEKALVVFRYMIKLGYKPKLFGIDTLFKGLCDGGMVEDAMFVLIVMQKEGRLPNRNSYNHLIDACNRLGRVLSADCVFAAALKQGVIPC